jgi:hypothetical protein
MPAGFAEAMQGAWHPLPKQRPSFQALVVVLKKLAEEQLSSSQA